MIKEKKYCRQAVICMIWFAGALVLAAVYYGLPRSEVLVPFRRAMSTAALVCLAISAFFISRVLIGSYVGGRGKPAVEADMLSKPLLFTTGLAVLLIVLYGFNKLSAFGTFFSLFGGLLLGWSLQAPLSGLVAWFLICLKRSIRPGDRVQFPALSLTGDIEDIGAMYLTLNQVGGSIASEEAVGRRVLIPNAMLFNHVAINYTVAQDAAYILDEVVVRITYNSDWEKAEQILLEAAESVTAEIIRATGTKPYIRSNLYDYGVYLRLRYKTRVQDRPEISYRIEKKIFETIQKTPTVDLAIPYVYSYRAAMEEGLKANAAEESESIRKIPLDKIMSSAADGDPADVRQLAQSIAEKGLLQPIVVEEEDGFYRVVAGHLRFEACKYLGWDSIAAVISRRACKSRIPASEDGSI